MPLIYLLDHTSIMITIKLYYFNYFIYIYVIMLNNIVIVLLITLFGIAQLCKKFCCKKKPDTFEIPQIIPPKINARKFDGSNTIATSDIHLVKFPTNSMTTNPEDTPASSSIAMSTNVRRVGKITPIAQ